MDVPEVTETDARLMISKIVCENFKSYAGIKELGPFHKCFTSIVGPNGSGKSNVIDSMLFVFGYRAKQIRSKKVSVLIHNSEQHQNIQSCTVSVHFQKIVDLPGDRYNVIPGSEFIVSRTAYVDNSSHYQLNGRKAPFKEIASLLRGSGIDLDHNRFLILQGEVEQIAQMKPKAQTEHDDGMLEFLEDIIGTSALKEPIEQLNKKVEELGEARTEKLNRVKATEKEKADLEGAKDEAEHYLSLQREKAKKQKTLYSKYIAEYGRQAEEVKKLKEEVDARVKEMEDNLATHSAKKKEAASAMKKATKVYAKLEEEEEQYKAQIANCETKDVRTRQDLKNARNNLKKQTKALDKEKEKLAELIASPEKLEKEIKEAEKKLKILEVRKVEADEQLAEAMAGLKTATQGLQEDKEELELQLVDLNKVVNETKSKFDMAKAELDMYKKKINSSANQLKDAEEKLSTLRTNLKKKKKEKEMTERDLPGKKQALKKAEEEIKVVVQDFEKLSQQLRERRSQMGEARSALESCSRRGQVLQSLMQQKEMGNLPGVHGRLGDLGAIDEKYDVAISTACGALDNIVVDTMDTAVKCVEFLRHNNLGVSTFIGLDKIEHLRSKATSKMATPEGSVRLFDVVKSKDPVFLTAFYFALRDTLVANDLDQATRIGLQGRTRHRVVTLSGQLVDTAGTMSGGGNRQIKGRMSSKIHSDVTPQELAGMEKKIQQDEDALAKLSKQRSSLDGEIKSLRTEIASMEKALKQLARDVEVMSVQEGALAQRIQELQREAKEQVVDHKHLAALEKTTEKTSEEYEKAAQEAKEIQDQVDSLHDAIMDKGKSEIQPKQRYVEAIRKDIEKTKEAMAKASVAIKTAGRNTSKSKKKVSSLEEEVSEMEAKINELQETLVTLEQEAKEVVAAQQKLRAQVVEREAELSVLKGQLDMLEKKEGEVQASMVDLRHERDKHTTSLKDYQQKMKYYKSEINKLGLDDEEGGDENKENSQEMDEEQLLALDRRELECEIAALGEKLEQMTPNMAAIEEYRRKEEQHRERLSELDQVTGERDEARNKYDDLRKDRLDRFMRGFSAITNKLKEMYQMITLGGDAELELVDSLDPFSEGIVFSVRPPKKSWKNISNLSGGEKTLSSLALVFALHHYKPSPLYVMDEIDAALDFKNVSIVAHYIKERTKNAQFIIISLRNNMFELADRLVGIYKTHNATKSITIDPYKLVV